MEVFWKALQSAALVRSSKAWAAHRTCVLMAAVSVAVALDSQSRSSSSLAEASAGALPLVMGIKLVARGRPLFQRSSLKWFPVLAASDPQDLAAPRIQLS